MTLALSHTQPFVSSNTHSWRLPQDLTHDGKYLLMLFPLCWLPSFITYKSRDLVRLGGSALCLCVWSLALRSEKAFPGKGCLYQDLKTRCQQISPVFKCPASILYVNETWKCPDEFFKEREDFTMHKKYGSNASSFDIRAVETMPSFCSLFTNIPLLQGVLLMLLWGLAICTRTFFI